MITKMRMSTKVKQNIKHTDEDFKKLAIEYNVLYAAFKETKKELKDLEGQLIHQQDVDAEFLEGLRVLLLKRSNKLIGETSELC